MAHKSLFSLGFIFLLTLIYAHNPSPFEFIKEFEGSHKGQKLTGLNRVKTFLAQFGYYEYRHIGDQANVTYDDFDDSLETALKTYQSNYHLKPTGTLDSKTITTMVMPRCGVADVSEGLNYMQIGKNKDQSFYANYPKWPISKSHLAYYIPQNTTTIAVIAIKQALKKWAHATHFTFSQTRNEKIADLKISFQTKNHGDNRPFDGPGGIVAHALGPKNGAILHIDGDESWSGSVRGGSVDLETVALHGIGHLLGLGHSSVEDAIMYPSFAPGVRKIIHEDDLEGIKFMYDE